MKYLKKGLLNNLILVIMLIICCFVFVLYTSYNTEELYIENIQNLAKLTSVSSVANNETLEEIKNREDVHIQLESIVYEIYLTEEKERIEKNKKETIEDYDKQLADIESKLETIRNDRLSF